VTKNGKAPVRIRALHSGVPGLDEVLGGGLPELSFCLVAGGPGAGKTTLVQQLLFANASPERPALFITVLGEPTIKLLRHQQQFSFFDTGRVGRDIHFVNLGDSGLTGDLDQLLAAIVVEVERVRPAFVAVDSFRSIARVARDRSSSEIEHFVQRLAIQLTTWEITSFLVGEHGEADWDNPVFTVADTILWLTQAVDHNSVVRKIQVLKMRGQGSMPGLHTFRIADAGLQVFPRLLEHHRADEEPRPDRRLSTGIDGLDEMTGGGIPMGDVVLVAGPTGSGKTTLAMQFVNAGLSVGESAVVAVFEERPREYLVRAAKLGGADFAKAMDEGRLEVMYLRPLDLSVDEAMHELRDAVTRLGATRVVIDSLSGFEVALAPTFRNDFRESLYRLLGVLTSTGATVMMTNEVIGGPSEQRFTLYQMSFLCDDIILNRFIEVESEYRRVTAVVKMRRGRHSHAIRAFEVTSKGIEIQATLPSYQGLTSGIPSYTPRAFAERAGLTARESSVLDALQRASDRSLASLAVDNGLDPASLTRALERIVELGYAVRVVSGHTTTFEPRHPERP